MIKHPRRIEGVLYTQSFDNYKGYATQEIDLSLGEYQQITCVDCDGSGVYWIAENDSQPCVDCKTSGKLWFNVY